MITSGFFTSRNGDKKYSAEQISYYLEGIVGNGVHSNVGSCLQVVRATGTQINVLSGRGFIDCLWMYNDSPHPLNVEPSEIALNRIDTIFMEYNKAQRNITITYKKGIPNSVPVPLAVTREAAVKTYRLANVYRAAGSNEVSQSDITDTRASADCGWVTGLIKQVDTSTLFTQYQAAYEESNTKYNNFYNAFTDDLNKVYINTGNKFETFLSEQTGAFNKWFESLTGELIIGTNLITYESGYTSVADGETIIPIEILQYERGKDIMQVSINGILLIKTDDYIINDDNTITLTKDVTKNQLFHFTVIKNVIGIGANTVVDEVGKLGNKLNEVYSEVQTLISVVEITLPEAVNTDTIYTLPVGYTRNNCIVTEVQAIAEGEDYVNLIKQTDYNSAYAGKITFINESYVNKKGRIILMKII